MKFITDEKLYETYLEQSGIQKIFSSDVRQFARLVYLHKGECLLYQGVVSDYLYLLFEGEIQMWAYLSEKEYSKFDYFPISQLDAYGALSALWDKPSTENIACNTNCYAFVVYLPMNKDRLLDDNVFLRFVCERLSKRYKSLNTRFHRMQLPPGQRFALFLLDEQKDGVVRMPLIDTAQILGISYRTMMRLVDTFKNEGLIEKKGVRNLQILDQKRLEDLAARTRP